MKYVIEKHPNLTGMLIAVGSYDHASGWVRNSRAGAPSVIFDSYEPGDFFHAVAAEEPGTFVVRAFRLEQARQFGPQHAVAALAFIELPSEDPPAKPQAAVLGVDEAHEQGMELPLEFERFVDESSGQDRATGVNSDQGIRAQVSAAVSLIDISSADPKIRASLLITLVDKSCDSAGIAM